MTNPRTLTNHQVTNSIINQPHNRPRPLRQNQPLNQDRPFGIREPLTNHRRVEKYVQQRDNGVDWHSLCQYHYINVKVFGDLIFKVMNCSIQTTCFSSFYNVRNNRLSYTFFVCIVLGSKSRYLLIPFFSPISIV